jgi:iron complex transport system substrate-binding protein
MVITRSTGLCALVLALLFVPAAAPSRSALPQRIVSLSPTATEDLFAIGAGKQVVAVDNQSNYPASAPKTKLSGYTPNAEAIAAYNPDLVVLSYNASHIEEALGKLHIAVLEQGAASNLAQAYSQLNQLGRVTGHLAGAASVVARMKAQIGAIVKGVPRPKPALTVYHEIDDNFYSATSKTFIGRVYTLLGLKNIADAADKTGSGYPKLSGEYIVGANPSLIVLADGQTTAKLKGRAGWSTIGAVQSGGVVNVNADISSRWGPRIVDFLRVVSAAVKTVASR